MGVDGEDVQQAKLTLRLRCRACEGETSFTVDGADADFSGLGDGAETIRCGQCGKSPQARAREDFASALEDLMAQWPWLSRDFSLSVTVDDTV